MIRIGPAEDHGLALDVIQIDGGTQSRATLNQHVVDDYAEAIKSGATFPPIVVFYDGKKHWLADGFHRFHAYRKAGRTKVAADIRQGTRRAAILQSVGANEAHGLRRTNDDKRRAVLTLLNDDQWAKWSDGEIAKRCAVTREYVNRVRSKEACDQVTGVEERVFIHPKTGAPAVMDIRRITEAQANPQKSGAETKEITSETLAPQGGEGGAEPVWDREEITPRNGYDAIVEAWTAGTADDREAFIAYLRVGGFIPSQAKASEDNGATGSDNEVPADSMTGEVSRQRQRRRDGGERPATTPQTPAPPPAGDRAGAAVPPPSAAPVQSRPRKPLRPHCLHPELCASGTRDHCHACKKSMAEVAA